MGRHIGRRQPSSASLTGACDDFSPHLCGKDGSSCIRCPFSSPTGNSCVPVSKETCLQDPCHIVATTEIKNSCGKSLSSEERGQPGAGLPLQGRGMRSLHPSRYFCPRIRYGGLNASLWKQLSGCRPALCALHCSSQGGQGRSVSVHRQPGAFTVVRETPALSRASTPGQGERGNLTN